MATNKIVEFHPNVKSPTNRETIRNWIQLGMPIHTSDDTLRIDSGRFVVAIDDVQYAITIGADTVFVARQP